MHIFTQDHNGGGQESALSTFQKRVIQQRCLAYTQQIIDQVLDQIGQRLAQPGEAILLFNPHGQPWPGLLTLRLAAEQWRADSQLFDESGNVIATQVQQAEGQLALTLATPPLPAVGYQTLYSRLRGRFLASCAFVKIC